MTGSNLAGGGDTSIAPLPIPGNLEYETNAQRLQLLSGIEINQNVPPALSTYVVNTNAQYYYQQFQLPANYQRSGTIPPDITGVQACVNVSANPATASFNYVLLASGISTVVTSGTFIVTSGVNTGWQTLASGTTYGVHSDGAQIWADIYFNQNVSVTPQLENATFSIGLQTSNVDGWNYSAPNPYSQGAAYYSDNQTPLTPNASFMFRLLSYSADAGTDWLGNSYRSVVINQSASNITTFGNPNPDYYWLSKPNPSKFAVEAIYFDISDSFGNPQTIDKILLEPITQGPFFHVYYSTDGFPVTDPDDWDGKLWNPVAQTFRLTKRDTFALPFPITANYIKIEFSRLQAQYYSAGTYSQAVIYRKFPQWLYNYFVAAQPSLTPDPYVANTINVVYNKLQLGFDYYLDDLQSEPLSPQQLRPGITQSIPSATQNQVSPQTLTQINTNLAPYTLPIGATVTGNSILSQFMRSSVNPYNYPVESLNVPTAVNTTVVSVPNRDQIVAQEQQPNMFFFITCRHAYQMTQADFEYNRAYFVGLRQAVFLREDYAVPQNQSLYIENAGDNQNAYFNDFVSLNGAWQVIDADQF